MLFGIADLSLNILLFSWQGEAAMALALSEDRARSRAMRCFMDSTFHCLRVYPEDKPVPLVNVNALIHAGLSIVTNAGNHQTALKTQSDGRLPEPMRRVAQAG